MNVCLEVGEECEYGKEAKETSEPMYVNRRLQSLRYSERSSSMSSMQSDGRPRNNPPLLNEIVSILEDMNYPVNQQLLNKAETMKVSFFFADVIAGYYLYTATLSQENINSAVSCYDYLVYLFFISVNKRKINNNEHK